MKDKETKHDHAPEHAQHKTADPAPAPAPTPAPAPKPVPPDEGFEGEKKIKIRMKSQVNVEGIIYNVGDEIELPERQALGIVGTGAADELPGTAPAPK